MNTAAANFRPVVRTGLWYGVGAGALCVLWVVGLYLTHNNPYGPKRLLSAVFVPPVAVLIGLWGLRRSYLPEGPGLAKSFVAGLLIALVTATISAAGVYAFARATGPQPIARHLAEMRQLLEVGKAEFLKQPGGRGQYERTKRDLASTPQALAADDFKNKLIFGLLLSLPGAIFFRK